MHTYEIACAETCATNFLTTRPVIQVITARCTSGIGKQVTRSRK